MNTLYAKKKLFGKITLLLVFFSISLFGLAQESRIYFTNMLDPVATPATATPTTGAFTTGTLSWASAYTGYFLTSGSAGNIVLNFSTPLALSSCGADNGSIIVNWGSTSNRPLLVGLNGGTNVQIDAITASGERSLVRTPTYRIPSGTTSISSIKLVSSGGGAVYIFSLEVKSCVVVGPNLSVSGTPTAFTYVQGAGPSATQQISVSGVSLTAGSTVKIDAPTGYEVSFSATTGFASSITIPNTAGGTLAATTVYLRLAAGLAVGPYAGSISISGGGASNTPTVAVTGSVTAPPSATLSATPTTLSGFTYIQGSGPSPTQQISVSGSVLTAGQAVTITALTNYEVSLSPTNGFGSSVVLPNTTGGTLAATPVYVRLIAGLTENPSIIGNITVSGGGATASPIIPLSGSVGPPPSATLLVSSTTLTGFSYVYGSGPSTSKTVDISGTTLTAGQNITVTPSSSYEVSLSSVSGYGSSVSITNTSGGTLAATTIYMRLKAGFSVAPSYPGTITVSGGGAAASPTVSLTGAVLATPLPAPAIGTPDTPTEDGFTAKWTAVPNATGYIVNVYQGTTTTPIVKTVNVSGQATISSVISGLSSSTNYSYKVIAVGDGTNYSNSAESAASTTIMTLTAIVVVTPTCAVTLYETDFKDWDAVATSGSSSNPVSISTRGGAGFILTQDMSVNPTTGVLTNAGGSSRTMTFAPFNFTNGGTVIVVGKNTTTSSMTGITGASGVFDSTTGAPVVLGNVKSMNYSLRFDLPTSVTGLQSLVYGFRGEIYKIIVCTNPPVGPSITTYPNPSKTLSTSAAIGGSTSAMNLLVKGFNLTGDVTLSIVGTDAGHFTLPVTSIAQASAATWKNVAIVYTPSVVAGVHNAQLKIESPGATPVLVNLVGITTPTAGTTPVILANTNPLPFWTSLIETTTNTLTIAGINLTGDVTLSIEGSTQFTVASPTIPKVDALVGKTITISYLGNSIVATENATLVISSPSATPVRVPLIGYTLENRPIMYDLNFVVSPSGTGVVTNTPNGTRFMTGTAVSVTAAPETGYKLDYWSDATGNSRLSRTITVDDKHKGTITVFFVLGQQIIIDPTGALIAYQPTNITTTGFTAEWSTVAGTGSYTVNVYDAANNIAATYTTSSTTQVVTGLTPNTPYTYQVVANNAANDTSAKVGPFNTLSVINPISCGQ